MKKIINFVSGILAAAVVAMGLMGCSSPSNVPGPINNIIESSVTRIDITDISGNLDTVNHFRYTNNYTNGRVQFEISYDTSRNSGKPWLLSVVYQDDTCSLSENSFKNVFFKDTKKLTTVGYSEEDVVDFWYYASSINEIKDFFPWDDAEWNFKFTDYFGNIYTSTIPTDKVTIIKNYIEYKRQH